MDLLILGLSTPPESASGVAQNYFAIGQRMMDAIESSVITAIDGAIGGPALFTLIFSLIGGIFAIHIMEGLVKGLHTRSASGMASSVLGVIYDRLPRIFIFFVIAMTALPMTNGGMALFGRVQSNAAFMESDASDGLINTWMMFLGSGGKRTFLDPDTNQEYTVTIPAPPVARLSAAATKASKAIDGITYSIVSATVDTEVRNAISRSRQNGATLAMNAIASITPLELVGKAVDEFLNIMLQVGFAAAQYSLAKALLLQQLFVKMSWYVALQFLPVFVLLAYFRPLQSFLVNLLTHFIVLSITCVIIGTLANVFYSADTWTGTNGIIKAAFAGARFDADGAFSAGSVPWFTARYAKVIGMGQVMFLLGATGMILSQVHGVLTGVIGGSFRSVFTGAGGSGVSTLFNGS